MFLLMLPLFVVLTVVVVRVINPITVWLAEMVNHVAGSARFATVLVAFVPDVVGQIFLGMIVFSVLCCIFGRIK